MKSVKLTNLALAGILGGSVLFASCSKNSSETKKDKSSDKKKEAHDCSNHDMPKGVGAAKFSDTHGCAGLNTCKGLGGCEVTVEKLAELAKSLGVDSSKAGTAHGCAGLNDCKGLGGCEVDAAKFASLKADLSAKK